MQHVAMLNVWISNYSHHPPKHCDKHAGSNDIQPTSIMAHCQGTMLCPAVYSHITCGGLLLCD